MTTFEIIVVLEFFKPVSLNFKVLLPGVFLVSWVLVLLSVFLFT